MPPARRVRPLKALGSLQLVGYANNPTRVITELAFITDEQASVLSESDHVDAPLEVQFEEFMDGVNSRGKGAKTRQRKMTVEQAAAVLLITVQKGHVELIAKKDDPHAIDVIKILPEAKKILSTFLPKLRGYGDIPYDQQYRGAIALAKRHFFPKGKAPTKKELMALLLQSYQEKRELNLKCHAQNQRTKALGVQTSLHTIDGPSPRIHLTTFTNTVEMSTQSELQGRVESPNNDCLSDFEDTLVASDADLSLENDDHSLSSMSKTETEPVQLAACTPVAPRSFNPYLTPVSNPRHVGTDPFAEVTPLLGDSPTCATINDCTSEDSRTNEGLGELLQVTATSQGRLNYYYDKFVAACQKITFLEGQKEEIEKAFDHTKRKLDETEHRLREANADRWKLKKWVDTLLGRVDSIYMQLGLLRGMTSLEGTANEEWSVCDPKSQGAFDPNTI